MNIVAGIIAAGVLWWVAESAGYVAAALLFLVGLTQHNLEKAKASIRDLQGRVTELEHQQQQRHGFVDTD